MSRFRVGMFDHFCSGISSASGDSVSHLQFSESLTMLHSTWLILPVVICLSQRLSHARPSIRFYSVKLRMAHYNSYSPLDLRNYMDNRGNSRANTCTLHSTLR